jgi:ATP-dependent DNA helicase PIF1
MEKTTQSLFITGKAGTGKSTLLRHFVATTGKKVVVVAPTGIAAINVHGQTIHSFFRFAPKLLRQSDLKLPRNPLLYQQLDTIIVDEISMVRADMMDMMDHFLRRARGRQVPFGGVQMLLFGDPYQLPPVVREEEVADYLQRTYGGYFFFDTPGYRQARITKIELDQVYRQSDPTFINVLNQVRIGQQNPEDLSVLNRRFTPSFDPVDGDGYFMLTTNNARVGEINRSRLAQLPGQEILFTAQVTGEFDEKNFPADYELHLKQGAQVMLIRNDSERRWVNGSIGWVSKIGSQSVAVRLAAPLRSSAAVVEVPRESWERIKYNYDPETDRITEQVIGSFTQFPLKLSWAMTIHKSQGQTFEKVMVDFDSGAFAEGQTYVALSRCKSLESIVLKTQIRPGDVKVSQRVHEFMSR